MTEYWDLGSRRELFVDNWLVAERCGPRPQLTHPKRREVVFTDNAPWEDQSALPLDVS